MTNQEKLELEKLRIENQNLRNENKIKTNEVKVLNQNNKLKDQIIDDLHQGQYKQKYEQTSAQLKALNAIDIQKDNEIIELKKKENCLKERVKELEGKLAIYEVRILKDSSNSSKPSSTNGFKRVITNRREPSTKTKGGQQKHKGSTLSEENIELIKRSGNVEYIIKNVGKTRKNKNKAVKVRKVIDIKITKCIIEYRYYPDNKGKYNIPKEHNNTIQYGENIKAMCTDLLVQEQVSTDGVSEWIKSISNNGIKVCKSTLMNWQEELCKKLKPQLKSIQKALHGSHYINHDESQIKINGETYNVMCACNTEYTRLWISKSKSRDALDGIGFLRGYQGIIVKDGTELYNKYGRGLSQCLSHIQRYIKGVCDFVEHKGAKEMKKHLSQINNRRNEYIKEGKIEFGKEEYGEIKQEYDKILKEWKKEWMESKENNPVYEEERKILTRLEEDQEEILYFLEDFKVPSTNNQAERDLRAIKIKQKIGKFRSKEGATWYAQIRSCINTYKKQGYTAYTMLKDAFSNQLVTI